MYATMTGNDVAVEMIVRSFRRLGLNVDHVNHAGMTALLIAAERGHAECATILALDGRANIKTLHPRMRLTAEQLTLTSTGCALRRTPVDWTLTPSSDGGPEACRSTDDEDFSPNRRSRRLVSLTELTPRIGNCDMMQASAGRSSTETKSSGVAIPDMDDSVTDELDDMVETTIRYHRRIGESPGRDCHRESTTRVVGLDEVDDTYGYHDNGCGDSHRQLRRTSLPSIRVNFNDGLNLNTASIRQKVQHLQTMPACSETQPSSVENTFAPVVVIGDQEAADSWQPRGDQENHIMILVNCMRLVAVVQRLYRESEDSELWLEPKTLSQRVLFRWAYRAWRTVFIIILFISTSSTYSG